MDKKEDSIKVKSIISSRISDLLSRHKMQQNELAGILDVDNSTVGKWISMKTIPRMGAMQKMADYFGVNKSYFFEDIPAENRLKARREELGLSIEEVSKYVGFTQKELLRLETGDISKFFIDDVPKMANILDVSPLYVMEYINRLKPIMTPTDGIKINIYGKVPAGIKIELIEDIDGTVVIPKEWTSGDKEYIALKHIDDQLHSSYIDNDIFIIRLQTDYISGQYVAVHINQADAVLKKVIKNADDSIILQSMMLNHNPLLLNPSDSKGPTVEFVGVVVEMRRSID